VLVHGSGGGGWNWDRVRPLLEERGHEVVTPELEMLDAATSIEDHAQQVVDAMDGLSDVVLAGHSYAGLPVALVTDRIPGRIAHAVYVDSFAPFDGESGVDQRPELENSIVPLARDGLLPPIAPEFAGVDKEDYELLRKGLTTTPLRCWTEPIHLTGAGDAVRRTYVWCTRSGFAGVADRLRSDGWDVRAIETKHMVMLTRPRELADVLLEVAGD